jgi:gliding motility-associated-like protein
MLHETTNPITVLATKTPRVTVSADATSICEGMPVKFSAAYTDGGLQPHFQWLKNNEKVGNDMPTYTASDIAHNEVIECILFSNEACAIDQSPKSNLIQMAVARSGDIEIGDKLTICAGMEASFNITAGYASYLWNDGSAGTSFKTKSEGLVWLKATDACGRSFDDSAVVVVIPPSTHFLPDNLEMCSYDKIQVRSSTSFQSYLWNGATGARVFAVEVPGTYRLAGTDTHGCVSFDTVVVSLKQNCLARGIYVPNAFTPQRNGKNDVFKPKVIGTMKAYQFAVFNRYGQIVFETKDVAKGWNGQLNSADQNSNVYIWYCKYQIDDAPARIEKGTVLLMR